MIRSVDEAIARLEYILELKDRIAYDLFETAQQLPYAAYTYDYDTDGADDFKGVQWIDFTLELYSEQRDFSLENKILIQFDDTPVTSSSEYIKSERMYMTQFKARFPYKLTTTGTS